MNGASICFFGHGTVNLGDWHINPFVTWDNQASSFAVGSQTGTFYAGANEAGTPQDLSYRSQGDFNCNFICNDDLSSMRLTTF